MAEINLNNYEAYLLDLAEGNLSEANRVELHAFVLSHPELEIDFEGLSLPVLSPEKLVMDDLASLKKSYTISDEENIISYFEGILTPLEREAIERQMIADPALAGLLKSYQATLLVPDAISFEAKNTLHRSEEDLFEDAKLIAYVEGCLSGIEKVAFEKELAVSSVLKHELSLFEQTRLKADLSLVFPNKAKLKKKARIIPLFSYRSLGVAAAAAVLLLIGFAVLFDFKGGENTVQPVAEINAAQTTKEDPKSTKENTSVIAPRFAQHKQNKVANNSVQQKQQGVLNVAQQSKDVAQTNTATETPSLATNNFKEAGTTENEQTFAQVDPNENQNLLAGVNRFESLDELTVSEDLPDLKLAETKKGVWQRAVNLARNANKLGLTAVNGEDEGNNRSYKISLSTFSIEKK